MTYLLDDPTTAHVYPYHIYSPEELRAKLELEHRYP